MKKIFLYLVFCWIAIVLISYFRNYPLPNFCERVGEFLFFGIIMFVSFQTGNFILTKSNLNFIEVLKIPFFIGSGLAVLSIVTFLLGIFGMLYKLVFYILILFLFLISLKNFKYTNIKLPSFDLKIVLLLFVFFIFLSTAFIGALVPPTFYDSLVYHLSIPAQYIKQHKICHIETNLFANFPQNIEMLYTMALLLYNDILANLIHWAFLPLTLCIIYGFSIQYLSIKISLYATLIFVITPAIVLLASGTYIDMGLTFYLFLSFVSLINWAETSEKKWLILSGLFSGFSLSIKYTAIISVAIFVLVILYKCVSLKQNIFAILFLFFIPAILVPLPWLVKNYIFTGEPFFPFFIFSQASFYIKQYLSHVSHHGTVGVFSIINLPWDITMEGVKFGGGFDVIGPFYLVFLPVLFLITKTDNIAKLCFVYTAFYFLIWGFSARVLRFLIPAVPATAIVFSACIAEFINNNKLVKSIVKIVFCIIIISNFAVLMFIQNFVKPLTCLFGNVTKDAYLSSQVLKPNNFYPAAKFMNETFNSKSKTLFVGEARNYYTNFNTLSSSPFDPDILTEIANNSKTSEELFNKLKSDNFTHILWNEGEYERLKNGFRPNDFSAEALEVINVFKKKHLNSIYDSEGICIYEIKK
ncbi:MAG: hypothetical protein AB1349_04565 [Elusimicrobiota bacterium]